MPMSCNRINNEAQPSYENTSVSSSYTFSLSSPQQVVWLDQILHPDNTCYNIGSVVLIEGELDETLLVQAFKTVVERHDALRLRLINTQELPLQKLIDTLPVSVSVHDFSRHTNPTEQAEQHLRSAFIRPFDLNNKLWRFELLRLGNNRWYWHFCCHHLIGDGTTLGLISEEIANTYSRLARSEEITESVPSYLDFVEGDSAYLSSKRYLQDQQFWLKRYENLPPALLQPSNSDKTREHPHPEPLIYQFDRTLFQRIEEVTAAQGLSILHFMYAVLACYFFRTTHFSRTDGTENSTEEIVFGIPVHNRKNVRQKRMIGMFTSVIPVGITVTPDDSFLDIMNKAAAELRRCYKHQRLPIAELNRHLQTRQKAGKIQLFDIMLSYEQIEINASLPDASLTYSKTQRGAPFPLVIALHQYAFTSNNEDIRQPVTLEFDYSPDYLNRAEAAALQSRLITLIGAALASPETPIRHLPMLSQAEQQQVLVDFNTTQMDFAQNTLVHQLIEIQAERSPDATAIEWNEQTLSYAELNRRANRLAHYLVALGVKPDKRVAICLERHPEMIVGLLAILKAGGAYVPLDPAYPAERLAYMLRDSEPMVLLTQTALSDGLEQAMPAGGYTTVLLDNQQPYLSEQPEYNPEPQKLGLTSNHPGYVIYTSGSTGLPKGVEMPLSALSNLLQWHHQPSSQLTETGKTLQFAALGFDVAFQEIFTTLSEGGCLVLISETMRRELQQFPRLIQQKQINRIFLPYIALQHLAEAVNSGGDHTFNEDKTLNEDKISCLNHIITAGEQLRITPAIRVLVERTGCRLHNHYGPTESHVVTSYSLDKDTEHWPVLPPIGKPIANDRIYILDAYGQPAPSGVTGEIYIAGRGLARGYLNRPELTAERFLPDPFSTEPDARMYKTGDLGRWLTDGNIEYLGRNDFQVKLRGFRIEPGEIETQLMQCDGVREAVVIARDDASDGHDGQKRLVAYLRPQAGARLEPAQLRQQLALRLADYMLPSAFVTLDTFPLTPNGKLDRQALPAPDSSAIASRPYVAPIDKIETVLAQIWQSLLGLKQQVGRHDHFFELGGHSLQATRLTSSIRNELAIELPLRSVFEHPTLEQLSQIVTVHLIKEKRKHFQTGRDSAQALLKGDI
ncbi:non-ribosomal peptide synthetase [Xenorhabdus innexi]|uniref:Amino acid adenylation n=1 Tax=Xenorhabdus innexi TaxID=290109 RepID=A0A1N6MWL7_9GAMM|nr:non-ribosomal peptide synthetase [Xenorhabdus innexi]PHM36582.1 Amino acid adenylation [Xenorhabdus innexi]SIP73129.1 putative Phenylalanine racemase (ATP-hydrolyzing) [Xenorhabdus innexi]